MSTTIPATTEIQGNTTNGTILLKLGATSMTLVSGVSVGMMHTINSIMVVRHKPSSRHYAKVKFMIVGSLFSFLSSLSTLILICIDRPLEGNLIGLVSTVIVVVMGFAELVIALMQFGPSHELKGPCDLALHICFFFHHPFTNKPKRRRGHRRIKEPLSAVRVFVIFISAFLMVGITALSVAIMVEIFFILND
ncbi:uncharacterized protein LOC110368664 isoform X3 [Fundulus heteroclitus]|uniref:uncharacterized protein LOC110368664 isoform X3 n=1 Tax=Fundulus heteroclitus TaxID=8078 RepID=UPI00165CB7EB|nr:uncharacterized protein LOC110368664 isoform X3 [Fundulus heteroclitus]